MRPQFSSQMTMLDMVMYNLCYGSQKRHEVKTIVLKVTATFGGGPPDKIPLAKTKFPYQC